MLANGLLLKLNSMGYIAQAFANELVIVIRGKYLSKVTDLMQRNLKIVNN